MAKNTNWDGVPDDEINESLYERIVGLSEFFPSFVNSAVSNSISATKVIAKNAFYYGSNGIWILATTFVIMVLPFAVQKELHELEKSEQQARQAMLLGPQKKAIQKNSCEQIKNIEDVGMVIEDKEIAVNKNESLISKYKELIFNDPEIKKANLYMTPIDRDQKNRYRKIIYNEGELNNSDLTKPPSLDNPHPFIPEKWLPPTHGRSLSAYVNHLPILQNLVELGVDLLEIDTNTKIGKHIVRLDWEKDVLPKLHWLVKKVGFDAAEVGSYLTRNPYFLLQDLNDMKVRVNYLSIKKFKQNEIAKIVTENRYWLNNEVQIIDKRLGWIQKTFRLKPYEVRNIITLESRVIMYGTGPLKRIVQILSEKEIDIPLQKGIILNDPRVFMMDPNHIQLTLEYCTKHMKLNIKQITKNPLLLRCPISGLKRRHTFLKQLKLDQYDENIENSIPLDLFLHPSDKVFAERACRVTVDVYNNYMKHF